DHSWPRTTRTSIRVFRGSGFMRGSAMYRITLINMPFANLSIPSIALTQLKAVVESRLTEQVSINLLYLNHDFANYLGLDLYDVIVNSKESQNSGLGDWFFRQTAFPSLP